MCVGGKKKSECRGTPCRKEQRLAVYWEDSPAMGQKGNDGSEGSGEIKKSQQGKEA